MASHRETGSASAFAGDLREIGSDDSTEAFFRTFLEAAPDAMVIIDAQGKIAIVNTQAEKIFGYKHKKLIGKPIEKLLPKRLRDMHVGFRDAYINDPDVRPMGSGLNLTAARKDGSEFPVEISLSPVETRHGRFVSSVIRDVTERKKMEQTIIAAQQETERANKANNAFLAAASHDLRQPVQALSLLNGALRRTVKDERALEMIEAQDQSLTAMTNLLNSLLDISRLDAGRVTPEIERFPVQRLIDRLSAEFGRQARQKGLAFVSADCGCSVSSDANLLAEIIQNLVSNAIRYTDHGTVRMDCERQGDDCVIQVIDTGIGIEAEQLDAIFREFHQCRAKGGSKEGFGLGLAIVRRLADLLGHEIRVTSELGKGSVFSVRLPIVEAAAKSRQRSERAAEVAGDRSGMIILIEDDVNVSNAWGMLLQAEGYEVAKAESAAEAGELIARIDSMPALIISDFHLLDGSTGVEAIASIRQHYDADIPAFIVSGDTSKVVKDARPVHNCTMMNKPVDTARLLAAAAIATRTGMVPAD